MADHYIDSSAAGGGDGSIGSPWNSLTQLNAHAYSPGDGVWAKRNSLLRGTVSIDFSGSIGAPIIFGAYGAGATPKYSGAVEVNSNWVHNITDPDNVWHVHDIQGVYHSTYGYRIFNVIFDGASGRWQNGIAILSQDMDWYWETDYTLYIYSELDPNISYSSIEYTYQTNLFYTGWADPRHYITFQDIHAYGTNSSGVFFGMWSDNWSFSNVTVTNTPRIALQMYGCAYHTVTGCTFTGIRSIPQEMRGVYYTGQHSASYTSHHNTFTYNTVTEWTGYAIDHLGYDHFSAPAHDVYIAHNDCSRSGTGVYIGLSDGNIEVCYNTCDDNHRGTNPVEGTFEEYGLGVSGVSNAWFHHNTCTNGRVGAELWNFEGEGHPQWYLFRHGYNVKFENNDFSHNTEHGWMTFTGSTSNVELLNNTMHDNGWAGIYIVEDDQPGTGNKVYNNTMLRNNTRIAGYANRYLGSGLAGWDIKNNANRGTTQLCLRAPSGTSATHEYNCYYQPLGNVVQVGGTTYDNTTVKSVFEPTCVNADPLFLSAGTTPDLHLKDTSPCIDTALNDTYQSGITSDRDDSPRPI